VPLVRARRSAPRHQPDRSPRASATSRGSWPSVALDISPRTVSTHLANVFQKLEIDSRGALIDLVREDPNLLEETGAD
jgi:hypothetical protein